MYEFVRLLESFWILRDEGQDYFRVKRAVTSDMKRFIGEFTGWKLISNSKLIRLEKIPAEAEPFMGISCFETILDYCLLCALLMFLDDISDGGQFLLSEFTEHAEKVVSKEITVDLTKYSDRKSLVRVMKFAEDIGMLKISEGTLVNLENDINREILYENTGVSGYFSLHHDSDISGCRTWQELESPDILYSDNDRGFYRTNRVYRRLILQPAMYWEQKDDPDSLYLKNQRASISGHLNKYLDGRLDICNNSAFYMLNEDNVFGKVHPSDKMLSGIVLFVCGEIRERLYELCDVSRKPFIIRKDAFSELIRSTRQKYSDGLSKEYREMSDEKIITAVTSYMISWKMIEETDDTYILRDGAFRASGKYPKDNDSGKDDE